MPQFDTVTYFSQFFWLAVVFGFLYLIIHQIIAPRIETILKGRQGNFDNNITTAEALSMEADSVEKNYESEIANATLKAENLKKEATSNLEKSFLQNEANLTEKLAKKHEKLNQDIDKIISKFSEEEGEHYLNLAAFMIEKISGKKPNQKLLEKCYKKAK